MMAQEEEEEEEELYLGNSISHIDTNLVPTVRMEMTLLACLSL